MYLEEAPLSIALFLSQAQKHHKLLSISAASNTQYKQLPLVLARQIGK